MKNNFYIPKNNNFFIGKELDFFQNKSNIFIGADFDKTFTVGNSYTSWSVLTKSKLVGIEYETERNELYAKYNPIEIDPNIPIDEKKKQIEIWWKAHLSLLTKYKISRFQIEKVANNSSFFKFRDGVVSFFDLCKKFGIPIVIVSAGIGNFIEIVLKINNIDISNISIEANFLTYDENGLVNSFNRDKIIHTCNKNDHILNEKSKNIIGNRKNLLVLGDSIHDTLISNLFSFEKLLSIGFLTENNKKEDFDKSLFDLVNLKDDFGAINNLF